MNEFEDPQLERQLGRLSGPFPDDNAAYTQVLGRVRQVRRRRAVAVSTIAGALLFAGVAFAAGRSDSSRTLTPGRPDVEGVDDSSDTSTGDSTATSAATHGSTVTTESTTPGVTGTSNGDVPATAPTSATSPQVSTPGTTSGSTSGSQPATTPPTSPATTATPPPATTAPSGPVTRSYSGIGGSIAVRFANGSLTLISSTATAGFNESIILSAGDRVEVRFESATHKTKVRVDVVGDTMQPYVEEQST